jgi:hypothetical protein
MNNQSIELKFDEKKKTKKEFELKYRRNHRCHQFSF